MLKLSGATLGGLAVAGPLSSLGSSSPKTTKSSDPANSNSFFDSLPVFPLGEPLDPNEMRITILGSSCIPRLSQECNSIFVETGSGDQFVFDCGTGVAAKYNAMGILMSRMDKIFFTHLHGDHTSDLSHIYCFGPAEDRKSPLFIWGPQDSNFIYHDPDQNIRGPYEDGTRAFCQHFRDLHRWHTESFSFGETSTVGYTLPTREGWNLPQDLVKVSDDDATDGYAIYPIELDFTKKGDVEDDNLAYYNPDTKVRITHFPAIHTRLGSVSYKLEWNGLSMIFSGDTKPNHTMVKQAGGVDLLIHEMVMPAQVWAEKNSGLVPGDENYEGAYNYALQVQNSSHTPQGAFGYLLSQMNPPPRLAVATHFQAEDDTIISAMQSVRNHYPVGEITFAADLMVINVSAAKITQRRAVVSPYAFYPVTKMVQTNRPKYWKYKDDTHTDWVMDPYAQIDTKDQIYPTDPDTGVFNFNEDGF
jgi:ribonuclease Z